MEQETMENAIVFDKQVFLDRIQFLIEEHCGGSKSKFNRIVQQRGAEYRWRTMEFFPKVEPLVRICNHFGVTMDWLLGRSEKTACDDLPPGNGPGDDRQMEIIAHYKDIAEHWKNLYKHVCSILNAVKSDPCHGVAEGQKMAS